MIAPQTATEFDSETRIIDRLQDAGWRRHVRGADGLGRWVHATQGLSLIESRAIESDGCLWSHISVARRDGNLPSWETIRDALWLIWPHKYGVIVVAPKTKHVNLNEVLHVWVNLDRPAVPDFTRGGSI